MFGLKNRYNIKEKIEFSKCSLSPGWNVKFKKSGKSLCTVYPKENYFTVLIVIGKKVKNSIETLILNCSDEVQKIYYETKEVNNQRWLMIDLEDVDAVYNDLQRFIEIKSQKSNN